jgi:hypothetical protein
MPGTQNRRAARVPRALRGPTTTRPTQARTFDLDLRMQWDSATETGVVWGDAWEPSTGELVALPCLELEGGDVQADVIALLSAIWSGRDQF